MSTRARRRDRRVYWRSHPVLLGVLCLSRVRPVVRIGRTVIVNGAAEYRQALTGVDLDRAAPRSTGGSGRRLAGQGLLFDQDGESHRQARRVLADRLSAAQVDRLRPLWRGVLDRRLAPLAAGRRVDLVDVAAEVAGATAAAILGIGVAPLTLAAAAAEAAALAVRDELPGPSRPGQRAAVRVAAARLASLVEKADLDPGLAAMLTVAAVNTTVSALPRAAAWCADAGLWAYAQDPVARSALAAELLRVTAPSPMLPRVAARPGVVGACPVAAGDRLILVARHAAAAHTTDPDPAAPLPSRIAQLVFGAGPHACPGAGLARAQLQDLLARLAPHRPIVTRARASRQAALPGWASLHVRRAAR